MCIYSFSLRGLHFSFFPVLFLPLLCCLYGRFSSLIVTLASLHFFPSLHPSFPQLPSYHAAPFSPFPFLPPNHTVIFCFLHLTWGVPDLVAFFPLFLHWFPFYFVSSPLCCGVCPKFKCCPREENQQVIDMSWGAWHTKVGVVTPPAINIVLHSLLMALDSSTTKLPVFRFSPPLSTVSFCWYMFFSVKRLSLYAASPPQPLPVSLSFH